MNQPLLVDIRTAGTYMIPSKANNDLTLGLQGSLCDFHSRSRLGEDKVLAVPLKRKQPGKGNQHLNTPCDPSATSLLIEYSH